jgi:hypothetical protein
VQGARVGGVDVAGDGAAAAHDHRHAVLHHERGQPHAGMLRELFQDLFH